MVTLWHNAPPRKFSSFFVKIVRHPCVTRKLDNGRHYLCLPVCMVSKLCSIAVFLSLAV